MEGTPEIHLHLLRLHHVQLQVVLGRDRLSENFCAWHVWGCEEESGNGAVAPWRCPRCCRSDVQTQPRNLTTRRLPAVQRRDPSDQGRLHRWGWTLSKREESTKLPWQSSVTWKRVQCDSIISSIALDRNWEATCCCFNVVSSNQTAFIPSTPALKHVVMLFFFF